MAYVFGMEGVPIFEMLFVISLLLLMGLVFILVELRRLSALIGKEKTDLMRFEEDLNVFEKDTGKKSTDKLVYYVKTSIAKGMSHDQIEASLVKRGWPKEELDSILDKIEKKK